MMLSLYFICLSDREYERAKSLFSTRDTGIVVYDGACGFCGRFAAFVQRRDSRRAFAFEHLQGDAGRRLVDARGADSGRLDTIYLVDGAGRLLARSTAVIFVMRCLGWPWSWLGAAAVVLPLRLRDARVQRHCAQPLSLRRCV